MEMKKVVIEININPSELEATSKEFTRVATQLQKDCEIVNSGKEKWEGSELPQVMCGLFDNTQNTKIIFKWNPQFENQKIVNF